MSGKLHEVLAVDADQEGLARKMIEETIQTFKNKEVLFTGKQRTLTMFGKSEANGQEMKAVEEKESKVLPLSSTIPENLNYLGTILANYYNVLYEKEATNQVAKADLEINGEIILKDVPVTYFLSMESRLKEIRRVILEIPTLEPTIDWSADNSHAKKNVWKSPIVHDTKTQKETDHKIVVAPTDKHPAQIFGFDIVKNIGQYSDITWSGKISSADKARLLTNLDNLINGVKRCRQRANEAGVISANGAGDTLIRYVFGSYFDRATANPNASV